MKRFLLSLMVLLTMQASAQINFTIEEPTPGQVITASNLYISGTILSSTYEMARIVSNTNGRTDTLAITPPDPNFPLDHPTFYKSISVVGFPQGTPIKLKITAIDVLGNQVSDSVYYTCNMTPPPPKAFILQPTAGTNAYPALHLKTNHTGTDTCTSYLLVKINGTTVFTDTSVYNDIDTTINVNSSQLGTVYVSLTVKDKWSQSASASLYVFSDNNPYMLPIYSGTGLIKDYNYHKILEAGSDSLYIIPDSNQTARRGMPSSRNVSEAYSTPYGALWYGSADGSVEFTNDIIHPNAAFDATAGKYVAYLSYYTDPYPGAKVMLKDMLTQNTIQAGDIGGAGYYPSPVVTENGLVVYGNVDATALIEYQAGGSAWGTTIISAPMASYDQYFNPVTDGKNVLFLQRDNGPGTYQVLWYNGTSNTTLSNIGVYNGNGFPPSPAYYALANGFIAYLKPGTLGQTQVWFRDTTGVSRQITFMGSNSYINGLNYKGDLIYNTPTGTYCLKYGRDTARTIGGISGSLFYRDSSWYVIHGRYLYKLNVDAFRTVANGNWTDSANWENGIVPSPNADVIISTNIVVNANVICNSLRVAPPGSITVAPGIILTVLH